MHLATKMPTALVVGAGSSGLVAAKELREVGFSVTVVEKRDDIGGLWYFGAKDTSVCAETKATSSKDFLQFSDLPFEEGTADFPHHTAYMNYLRQYVAHNKMSDILKFEHIVKEVMKGKNGGWQVTICSAKGETQEYFDKLVMATGMHQVAAYPEFPGLDTFGGVAVHSSVLLPADHEAMKSKRVCIIGAGESGADITHGLVGHASEIMVSMRKGQAVSAQWRPERTGKVPVDHEMQRAKVWLPRKFLHDYNTVCRTENTHLFCPFKTIFRIATAPMLPFIALFNPRMGSKMFMDLLRPRSFLTFFQEYTRHGPPDGVALAKDVEAYVQKVQAQGMSDSERAMGYELRHIMNWHSGAHMNTQSKTKRLHWLTDIQNGDAKIVPGIKSINGKEVTFADGVTRTVDTLVYCTGFKTEVPSLTGVLDSPIVDSRDLYKNVFHPRHGDEMAFIGYVRPDIGSLPACAEMQARWMAQVFAGNKTLPSKEKLFEYAAEGKVCHTKLRPTCTNRVTGAVDYSMYMEDIAIETGCAPQVWKFLLFLQPWTFMSVMMKPMTSAQYRLHGTGAKPEVYPVAMERLSSTLLPENAFRDMMLWIAIKPFFILFNFLGFEGFKPIV